MSKVKLDATRRVALDPEAPDAKALRSAARVLRAGGLVAFATETVYGLGADATQVEAVARIFEAKGRPSFNPLIVHVHDVASARACVADWPSVASRLAERFWPGPLTMVLPRSKLIPDIVTAGQDTVGVRVPALPSALALIKTYGRPIAAPSANRSNAVSPTTAQHVLDDLEGRIEMVLDSGATVLGLESTVLDLTGARPRLLRPGMIDVEALAALIGSIEFERPVDAAARSQRTAARVGPRSPGQLDVHYAPTTRCWRIERDNFDPAPMSSEARWALLTLGEPPLTLVGRPVAQVELGDPDGAAAKLYLVLRELDALALDAIVIVAPPDLPAWRAVRDRIERASQLWTKLGVASETPAAS